LNSQANSGEVGANGVLGKILVVDDELEFKNSLVDTLNAQAYITAGCTSGLEALPKLRNTNFDILLTDLMMPEMNGIALLQDAQKIDPSLVAVLMTGQATIQMAVDALKEGAFDYILKPVRLQTLLPMLTRAMKTRRLQLENVQLREAMAIHELSQTIEDTTKRRKAEDRLAAQYAVTRGLADSDTLEEGILRTLQALCESFEWVYGVLWTVDREANVLRCNQLWHSPGQEEFGQTSREIVFAPGIGLPGSVWSHRQAKWIPDVASDPIFSRGLDAEKHGLHAAIAFPILLGSEVLGVVEFFAQSIREPDSELLAMMATIGSQIGQFLERRNAEKALRTSEEQLRQSQKLEAIGQLAGGVAHDFNNLLTVIGGYSSILLGRISEDSPHRVAVEEIKKASERASALTRQLLAFSRKQILQPKLLDLNGVIADLEKMVRRLISEDIVLFILTDPLLGKVKADPGQVEQVLLNLIVNARDAMPQGGKLTIETANRFLSEEYALRHAASAGRYVMLAVSDSGCGMDAEVKEHIFEPFFTTKGAGKGTGLGLSTVYGIVKQSGGHIWLYSELNRGTTFKVYLPRLDENQEELEASIGTTATPKGTETVLLVEDEEQVRGILTDMLESQGYHVVVASDGNEALNIASLHDGTIHLLLTDVVMPQMSGRQLAEHAAAIRPEMKILYMSGYTDDAIVRHGLLDEKLNFLQKPFDSAAVARKVREVLDS
jgi:signal transduction histidine kinase/FixJ family two-component response regulator